MLKKSCETGSLKGIRRKDYFVKKFLSKAKKNLLEGIEIRPVKSLGELKIASQIVYREYLKNGYSLPNASQMRLITQQATQITQTLIMVYRNRFVLGTLTIVQDSPFGLPMDRSHKMELDALRKKGIPLREISMLAMNNQLLENKNLKLTHADRLSLVMRLFYVGIHAIRSMNPSGYLVIATHPKHDFIYEALSFQNFGAKAPHAGVEKNPAVAKFLDLDKIHQYSNSLRDHYFDLVEKPINMEFADSKFKFSMEELFSFFKYLTCLLASYFDFLH